MDKEETRSSAKQFIRYGVVGVASNLTGYLLFLLITSWGVEPKKTMTLLYGVGATIGYIGNRQWAFAHKGALLESGFRYLIGHLFGYLLNLFILLTFVDRFSYSYQLVQAAAILVVAVFLFFTFKYFVFPKTHSCTRGNE